MPAFLCDYLNEIVILSDGSVTTCCLDPLGINIFGNIYEESLNQIQIKYLEIRKKITNDVYSMPRCKICYDKIKEAGFPLTGTYNADPAKVEIEAFLGKGQEIINRNVIELTCLCNLHCNGCMQSRYNLTRFRKKYRLDTSKLIAWLAPEIMSLKNIRLYNYGETFLHPRSIDFVQILKLINRDVDISIATNGMLLNTPQKRQQIVLSGVNSLIFSIHGASQKATQTYMTKRFDFDKILKILKELISIKKNYNMKIPILTWKYLLFPWNDSNEEIERAISLTEEIGLDSITFDVVGFPPPSNRFKRGSTALEVLQRQKRILKG